MGVLAMGFAFAIKIALNAKDAKDVKDAKEAVKEIEAPLAPLASFALFLICSPIYPSMEMTYGSRKNVTKVI